MDELELARLVALSLAALSIMDFDRSRLCFCKNFGSFEPCCGLGEAGAGVLREYLLVMIVPAFRDGADDDDDEYGVTVLGGVVQVSCTVVFGLFTRSNHQLYST